MTSLAGLSKIVVRFSPSSPLARPTREFLARVGCSKARATNPNCEVRAELEDVASRSSSSTSTSGTVEVVSSDKKTREVIDASGLSAEAIVRKVMSVGAAAAAASAGPAGRGGGGGGGSGAGGGVVASGPPPSLTKQQLETTWGFAGSFDAGASSRVNP